MSSWLACGLPNHLLSLVVHDPFIAGYGIAEVKICSDCTNQVWIPLPKISGTIIPLIVHLSRKRTLTGFFKYIGLTQSNLRANLYAFPVAIVIAGPVVMLGILNDDFNDILSHPKSVTGSLKQMGWNLQTGVIILIVGLFKTALAEEIFFRGFLAKRLISLTGFQIGNIIQAIIFGLIHATLFFSMTRNIWFLVIIFVFPTIGAYLKVCLNEK